MKFLMLLVIFSTGLFGGIQIPDNRIPANRLQENRIPENPLQEEPIPEETIDTPAPSNVLPPPPVLKEKIPEKEAQDIIAQGDDDVEIPI